MTIKSTGVLDLENRCPSQTIICSNKTSNMSSSRSIKMKVSSKDSSSLGSNKHKDIKSPYFVSDKVHLLRRVTDKRPHKNPNKIVSSFPLAVTVYKANSDEFKSTKCGNKKVRKSVLTLPNKPAPMPKTYTVSDLNDSEYFNDTNNDSSKNGANKPKKRRTIKRKRKPRMHERAIEYYDRDARYCSQLNIDLDCSSSDILNLTGDGENISKLYKSNNSLKAGTDQNDVWSVLRNINKFQFKPPPHASQESVIPLRKRRPAIRKINNCNDTHIIETCHTEEFSYISSFEVDSRSQGSCSPSSSFDRVTVIDQQNEKGSIIEQFSQNIFESKQNFRSQIKNNARKSRNKTKNINYPQVRNEQIMQNKKKLEIEPAPENIAPNNILQLEDENVNTFCKNELKSPEKIEQQRSVIQNSIYNDSVYEDRASNVAAVNRFGDTSRLKNKSLLRCLTKKDNNITKKSDIIDADKEINGITKVVVSRGQDLVSSKISESQRKPHLALTIPNTNITKLSQAEIRRRLANLKFPIVVLGKDQLTDQGIPVVNYDPPQFRGLDKQIWPFMLEWLEVKHSRNNEISQKKKAIPKIRQKIYNEEELTTMMGDIKKILEKPDRTTNKKIGNVSTLNKREPLVTKNLSRPIVVQKPKPVSFLKNKMFSFLQKSPMSTKLSESNWKSSEHVNTVQKDKVIDRCETSETTNKFRYRSGISSPINKETKAIDPPVINKQYSSIRHPWAKGKCASDFIENIIKKMRNGVYYGVDHKEIKCQIHGSEISTQTEASILKNAYCQNNIDSLQVASNEDDALKNILDVDKNFSTLEIETITSNQIAVKHCLTNVVIRFDIQVYGEVKTALDNKALSCIPINVQDNDEKVFKCNTSIVNAFLPAELCTMIPSIMETMLNADKILYQNSAPMETVQSQLSSVSDSIGFTSTGLVKPFLWMQSYLPGLTICDEIKPLLMGRYPVLNSNLKIYKSTDLLLPKDTYDSIICLLPRIRVPLLFRFIQMSPQHTFENKLTTLNSFNKKPNHYIDRKTDCMALQPYEPKNLSVIPSFGIFNPTEFLKNVIKRMKNNNEFNITMTFMSYNCDININCDITHYISQEQNQIQNYPTPNVGLISLYDAFTKSDHKNDKSTDKTFENGMESKQSSFATGKNKNKQQKKTLQPIKTLVKKSFVKCYRKCNSLSSISTYKSTPLNLIKNIEDFCIALGSNSFCSVLDGYIVKKILAAIREMESWISEITPKQALLILLLSNKKDTPNLIRFRPILLQGIAVNRITKAVELDTEIEVIENENFYKSTLYERFSYTPTCAKNLDNLLEELYWIAKTTASDYQKPFDESSEKLLKSLLEKRKKLNPSYLRVMARYVGLGLLKPSK